MKKVLKVIWNEFIYGGHLLALGPVAINLSVMTALKLPINFFILVGVYLLSYIVYFFDRIQDYDLESSQLRKDLYKFHFKYRIYISVTVVIALLLSMYAASMQSFYLSLLFIILGFFYGIFFKKLTHIIIGFKSFFVAILYSGTILFTLSVIPTVNSFGLKLILILFFFYFMRWFINTSFCDVKDREVDKKIGYKTLAAVLTNRVFLITIHIINLFSLMFLVIMIYYFKLPYYLFGLSLVFPFTVLYLNLYQKQYDLQKLTNIWADAEVIIWLFVSIGGFKWV
ncbi:MAG: UbiA family prenyltransferase [Patescibacteria group bacterium]